MRSITIETDIAVSQERVENYIKRFILIMLEGFQEYLLLLSFYPDASVKFLESEPSHRIYDVVIFEYPQKRFQRLIQVLPIEPVQIDRSCFA